MKILIFSWRGPKHPHAGGAEYSTYEHCKGWVKAGHKVTLFTSSFKGSKAKENISGVDIIRIGNQVFGVHLAAMMWYLFGKHEKFDIVIDEIHGIPFFSPIYVRIPKLVFIHEVAKEVWKLNPWPRPFNLIPAFFGTAFEPLVFKIFYQKIPFMTVSNSTKDDLMNWGIPERNISVVHNGFRSQPRLIKRKENKKTVIYLGALSRDKGIEDAIVIFSLLYKWDKNINFWVVGKGEKHYLDFLKNKVKRFGLNKLIKFFGFVDDQEKFKLLSKSHILINPSIREGWGLVVIEAASVGTPTVAYNVAGLKDSIVNGRTGILSNPNPGSCADRVKELFENTSLYNTLGKNCICWSKKYSWKESVIQSLELLEKVNKKK